MIKITQPPRPEFPLKREDIEDGHAYLDSQGDLLVGNQQNNILAFYVSGVHALVDIDNAVVDDLRFREVNVEIIVSEISHLPTVSASQQEQPESGFTVGDRVEKIKGSSWRGRVCGFYSTELTPVGVCVESENEPGSVQIYPATALRPITPTL